MSVLIRGMEMPTKCADCLFIDYFKGQWYCHSINDILETGTSKRDERCPLVPVPHHGRLIDADALVERIDGIWDCNDMVFRPNDKICKIPEDCKGCKWAQTKDCIQRMAENAPTIIPAEEGE